MWLESPTNPALELADIETIAAAAHEAGAHVVVDNTFATPLRQLPLTMGADIVVHSATKYLSGHADAMLGAIVTRDDQLYDVLKGRRDLAGAVPGTLEAWLALRGLRTLHLRVERAESNARALAERLREHSAVEEVRYPGFGGIVSIVLSGGPDAADLLVRSTSLWVHATSLGGVESTFERRRRWKSEPATIPDALVRLSVGIEDVEDLWRDLAPPCLSPERRVVIGRLGVFSPPLCDDWRVRLLRRSRQSVSALVSRRMNDSIISGAVIRPSTTASTCSAIGASTPTCCASASREEHDFAPSATWRVEATISAVVMPSPSFSPKVRLRDSGEEHVATRSPRPARPIRVSGLASIAIASRAVSARPRVISDAVVLSPNPSPTAIPTESATTFL